MKLYINIHDDIIYLGADARGPDGLLAHARWNLKKGETFSLGDNLSISYDTFIAHGEGLFDTEIELNQKK